MDKLLQNLVLLEHLHRNLQQNKQKDLENVSFDEEEISFINDAYKDEEKSIFYQKNKYMYELLKNGYQLQSDKNTLIVYVDDVKIVGDKGKVLSFPNTKEERQMLTQNIIKDFCIYESNSQEETEEKININETTQNINAINKKDEFVENKQNEIDDNENEVVDTQSSKTVHDEPSETVCKPNDIVQNEPNVIIPKESNEVIPKESSATIDDNQSSKAVDTQSNEANDSSSEIIEKQTNENNTEIENNDSEKENNNINTESDNNINSDNYNSEKEIENNQIAHNTNTDIENTTTNDKINEGFYFDLGENEDDDLLNNINFDGNLFNGENENNQLEDKNSKQINNENNEKIKETNNKNDSLFNFGNNDNFNFMNNFNEEFMNDNLDKIDLTENNLGEIDFGENDLTKNDLNKNDLNKNIYSEEANSNVSKETNSNVSKETNSNVSKETNSNVSKETDSGNSEQNYLSDEELDKAINDSNSGLFESNKETQENITINEQKEKVIDEPNENVNTDEFLNDTIDVNLNLDDLEKESLNFNFNADNNDLDEEHFAFKEEKNEEDSNINEDSSLDDSTNEMNHENVNVDSNNNLEDNTISDVQNEQNAVVHNETNEDSTINSNEDIFNNDEQISDFQNEQIFNWNDNNLENETLFNFGESENNNVDLSSKNDNTNSNLNSDVDDTQNNENSNENSNVNSNDNSIFNENPFIEEKTVPKEPIFKEPEKPKLNFTTNTIDEDSLTMLEKLKEDKENYDLSVLEELINQDVNNKEEVFNLSLGNFEQKEFDLEKENEKLNLVADEVINNSKNDTLINAKLNDTTISDPINDPINDPIKNTENVDSENEKEIKNDNLTLSRKEENENLTDYFVSAMQEESDFRREKTKFIKDIVNIEIDFTDGNYHKVDNLRMVIFPLNTASNGTDIATDICAYIEQDDGYIIEYMLPQSKRIIEFHNNDYVIFVKGFWENGQFGSQVRIFSNKGEIKTNIETTKIRPDNNENLGIGHNVIFLDYATTLHLMPIEKQDGTIPVIGVTIKNIGFGESSGDSKLGDPTMIVSGETYKYEVSGYWKDDYFEVNSQIYTPKNMN